MSDSSPLTKSISLCPPATRMVVIMVYVLQDGQDETDAGSVEIHPVIALQAICDGDGSVPSYDAVIHDGGFGFMTYNQFCTRYLNRKLSFDAVKLIVTPWPPEEDGERLRRTKESECSPA